MLLATYAFGFDIIEGGLTERFARFVVSRILIFETDLRRFLQFFCILEQFLHVQSAPFRQLVVQRDIPVSFESVSELYILGNVAALFLPAIEDRVNRSIRNIVLHFGWFAVEHSFDGCIRMVKREGYGWRKFRLGMKLSKLLTVRVLLLEKLPLFFEQKHILQMLLVENLELVIFLRGGGC